MTRVAVIDCGLGNIGSMLNMLRRVGAEPFTCSTAAHVEEAEKLVLPGVGAYDAGMMGLQALGIVPTLRRVVLEEGRPILGVCLGMQMLAHGSEEGKLPGLGWLEADVRLFKFPGHASAPKVPHMGWNEVRAIREHPLFPMSGERSRFYFAHSYFLVCARAETIVAYTYYGIDFASVVASENIIGVQFHPEKSHRFGMELLRRFVAGV